MESNIKEKYYFLKLLGQGSYSKVIRAIKRESNEEFAIKVIEKKLLTPDDLNCLIKEVEILTKINHPNIIKLYELYEDKERFYMVLDYMKGGDLLKNIYKRKTFTEKDVCEIIITLVDAIKYFNSNNISHRDIKPDNILFESEEEGSIIKIIDFGFAKISLNEYMTTQCGTPHFVAPEIINKTKYTKSCDIWSIGVLMYYWISGCYPFEGASFDNIFNNIKKGEFNFKDKIWKEITKEAKELICKMLVVDYDKRIKPDEIINHPWREKCANSNINLIKNHL